MCARGAGELALLCALLVISARAVAYTVDCNHEYTDCDTELSKITAEDDEPQAPVTKKVNLVTMNPVTTKVPVRMQNIKKNKTSEIEVPVVAPPNIPEPLEVNAEISKAQYMGPLEVKPKPRLLNLNVDELQNFANALHNESNPKGHKKDLTDLSDVNLDVDDDEETRIIPVEPKGNKDISDKFYTNLQAPFQQLMNSERGSEELDTCKENEIIYKLGDRMERGCEESCECVSGGVFECSPRCKHPYIRRGRRLNDPLCFESPVDECCSIIACATGSGDTKITKLEVCKYGNETHPVGSKWHIDCDQTCSCEPNSVVTCKPRCNPLPVSDKCINVQDPNDACCEVQVCDVSHDVHEEPENVTTSTTSTTTTEIIKGFEDYDDHHEHVQVQARPVVVTEPIGSVKVLQNNSVQVNLMHMNKSEDPIHLLLSNNGGKSFNDVELKYSNLILNLEGGRDYILKTKETGTKFNFTITASDTGTNEAQNEDLDNSTKIGCVHEGKFYPVGEEFHIGCEQLCECTGHETKECAALVCPSHVGLELVSKGCVRWAPSPPPIPPNCCPRSARCLSDGTCHYKGAAVPNWSEVPVSLTGCEQRCFCENGELDCQDVCSPLSPVPPQNFRCPPNHKPAAVNISDEDCCKQWSCVPIAENESTFPPYRVNIAEVMNYVTPVAPVLPTMLPVLPSPPLTTDSIDFYRHLSPVKSLPKYMKTVFPATMIPKFEYSEPTPTPQDTPTPGENLTVFTLDEMDTPFKAFQSEQTLENNIISNNWDPNTANTKETPNVATPSLSEQFQNPPISYNPSFSEQQKHVNTMADDNLRKSHDYYHNQVKQQNQIQINSMNQVSSLKQSGQMSSSNKMNQVGQMNQVNQINQVNQMNQVTETEAPKQTGPEKITLKHIYEPVRKLSKFDNYNYFLPSIDRQRPITDNSYSKYYTIDTTPQKPNTVAETLMPVPPTQTFFEPSMANRTADYLIPRVVHPQQPQTSPSQNLPRDKQPILRKQVTILKTKDLKNQKPGDLYNGELWNEDTKKHVLTKLPNPYETVLLRAVPNSKIHMPMTRYGQNVKQPMISKSYTALDLEHLLNQMEMESVVNKNLGRSADRGNPDIVEGSPSSEPSPTQDPPVFLPTVPPDVHFPPEDIADYDQNNIHRPSSPSEPGLAGLPPGLTLPPPYGDNNKKLTVISLQSDSPNSVKMLFGLPPVLVGLRGSVDLRYTDKAEDDISHWYSQVFAPADEILTTPRLEFRLTGLKPRTTYKIKGKLYLHNLPVEPESDIYTVRTQDAPSVSEEPVIVEEKRREINSHFAVSDVNDTMAHVSWKRFDEQELQYIDGIQVRYRPVGTPIFSMTELLHHTRTSIDLRDLRPETKYEASLVLIPPPKSNTELIDTAKVEFTTLAVFDPYNWTVTIETRAVGAGAAEVWWRGIPEPAERWVRVYRAAHACNPTSPSERREGHDIHHYGREGDIHGIDHERHERDAFRLATRDLPPTIMINGLLPDTKCRIWLELFLTNGKVKTSNVLDINTKSLDHPETVDNEVESSSSVSGRHGDYYGALVGVGAVAALGALCSILLLLVVLRRHRPRSVPITTVPSAPRESSLPPYDNPAYKLELQQETMDL